MEKALELLQDYKLASDDKSKVAILDNLKEWVVKSNPSLIAELCGNILDLSVEKKARIREKLVREFAGQFVDKYKPAVPMVLSMYSHLVQDRNDVVTKAVSFEMARNYAVMAINVIHIPADQAQKGKLAWQQLQDVSAQLMDLIDSDRSEATRTQSIRFSESYMLFGISIPKEKAAIADPRKRGTSSSAKSSSRTESNSGMIPPGHGFLKQAEVEAQADEIFTSLEQWARSKGPEKNPFSNTHMAQLTQAMCRVGAGRTRLWRRTADAMCFMLRELGGILVSGFNDKCRKQVTSEVQKLIGAAPAPAGEALPVVEDLKECLEAVRKGAWASGANKAKRNLDAASLSSSASSSSSSSATAGAAGVGADDGGPHKKARKDVGAVVAVETSNPIDDEPRAVDAAAPHAELSDKLLRYVDPNRSLGGDPQPRELALLAASGLHRLWEAHATISKFGRHAERAHVHLCARATLTASLASLDHPDKRTVAAVEVLLALPSSAEPSWIAAVPTHVLIPKPLWYFCSLHLLGSSSKVREERGVHGTTGKAKNTKRHFDSMDYLLELLRELYAREWSSTGEAPESDGPGFSSSLYGRVCLVIVARLIQRSELRPLLDSFLTGVPRVPASCMALLNLLMHGGSSDTGPVGHPQRGAGAGTKGTKGLAIQILSELAMSEDANTAQVASRQLLHAAACADFEVRTKAVAFLTEDMAQVHLHEGLKDTIYSFAVAVAAQCLGADRLRLRFSERDLEHERLGADKDTKKDEDTMDTDDADARNSEGEPTAMDDEATPTSLLQQELESEVLLGFESPEVPLGDATAMDAYCRRMFHLLVQLSQQRPALFSVIFDLYGTAKRCHTLFKGTDAAERAKFNIEGKPTLNTEDGEGAAAIDPADGLAVLLRVIESDMSNVMRAIPERLKDEVFETIAHSDPLSLSLVTSSLEYMHESTQVPASAYMLRRVKCYTDKHLTGDDSLRARALSVVLSGIDGEEEVKDMLHLIVSTCAPKETATIAQAFRRVVDCRPPLLSFGSLLSWVLRLPASEKENVKMCVKLDVAGTNPPRLLFTAAAFKEALVSVMADEEPPILLMWAAIIGSQKYADVRVTVLGEVVPQLIRRRIWDLNKDLWLGVVATVKNFGTHAKAEPTLRAVLGLPLGKLSQLLKVAATVKKELAGLLSRLSPQEREEVVSGQWAGLADDSSTNDRAKKEEFIKKEVMTKK